MIESALAFHAVESPAPDARVAGPVVWLRGWIVGKPGFGFTDVRVRDAAGSHRGLFGLPRADLAAHFGSNRPWLAAGFVVGVPLPEGAATLHLEAQDAHGNWIGLQSLALTVAADGAVESGSIGRVIPVAGGSQTERTPHLPFHGHLDLPAAAAPREHGGVAVFGWLLHEAAALRAVTATLDGRTFFPLHHGLTDEALAQKLPQAAARQSRLRGRVPAPPTLATTPCLRIYAELADGSAHLCFGQRIALHEQPERAAQPSSPPLRSASLPPLPSGRPRRLLMALRTLRPDDATLRALDVARFLRRSGRWVVRVVGAEDGTLREAFEAAECPVQLIDLGPWVDSGETDAALALVGREIWWRNLDAVALFDPVSRWAGQVARRHGIAVFEDAPEAIAWVPTETSRVAFDPAAPLVAPIRGLAAHGAETLVQALADAGDGARVILADWRDHADETLLAAALAQAPRLGRGEWPALAAGCVCPAFANHPHQRLLAAIAGGVPVVSTPSPLLSRLFAHGEIQFVPPGNPLALAHALADLAANPAASARRAEAARRVALAACNPAVQLPRWLGALAAAAASR